MFCVCHSPAESLPRPGIFLKAQSSKLDWKSQEATAFFFLSPLEASPPPLLPRCQPGHLPATTVSEARETQRSAPQGTSASASGKSSKQIKKQESASIYVLHKPFSYTLPLSQAPLTQYFSNSSFILLQKGLQNL